MVVAVLGKHLQIEFEDPFFLKHDTDMLLAYLLFLSMLGSLA